MRGSSQTNPECGTVYHTLAGTPPRACALGPSSPGEGTQVGAFPGALPRLRGCPVGPGVGGRPPPAGRVALASQPCISVVLLRGSEVSLPSEHSFPRAA